MVYSDAMSVTQNNHKGDLVATEVFGTTVRMWFDSPTGDSSDVQISDLQCNSHDQAVDIANRHNEMWNIDTRHYRMADFKHPPEGIKPIW